MHFLTKMLSVRHQISFLACYTNSACQAACWNRGRAFQMNSEWNNRKMIRNMESCLLSQDHENYLLCKIPSVCQHLASTINTCNAESMLVLTLLCVVLSSVGSRLVWATHGLPFRAPVYRGPTSVPNPEAKSQPIVVLVGVLRLCDGRARGRAREYKHVTQMCNSWTRIVSWFIADWLSRISFRKIIHSWFLSALSFNAAGFFPFLKNFFTNFLMSSFSAFQFCWDQACSPRVGFWHTWFVRWSTIRWGWNCLLIRGKPCLHFLFVTPAKSCQILLQRVNVFLPLQKWSHAK